MLKITATVTYTTAGKPLPTLVCKQLHKDCKVVETVIHLWSKLFRGENEIFEMSFHCLATYLLLAEAVLRFVAIPASQVFSRCATADEFWGCQVRGVLESTLGRWSRIYRIPRCFAS